MLDGRQKKLFHIISYELIPNVLEIHSLQFIKNLKFTNHEITPQSRNNYKYIECCIDGNWLTGHGKINSKIKVYLKLYEQLLKPSHIIEVEW